MINTLLLSVVVTDPPPVETVDEFARFLAILGLIVTIVLFSYERRGKIWRGRFEATSALRPSFDEVRNRISAAEQDARNVDQLWTVTATDAIEELEGGSRTLPDWRLRRMLKTLLAAVATARGGVPPTDQDTAVALSAERHAALKNAGEIASSIVKRLDTTKRKGAAG